MSSSATDGITPTPPGRRPLRRALTWLVAWMHAPLWPSSRRRYWANRRTALATHAIHQSMSAALSGLMEDRRLGAQRPTPRTLAAAAEATRAAGSTLDPDLVAAVAAWRSAFDAVARAWPFPEDAHAAIADLRSRAASVQARLEAIVGEQIDAETDVIATHPMRTLEVGSAAVPASGASLVLYRYGSIRLWRVTGLREADISPELIHGGLRAVAILADGEVAVAGQGIFVGSGPDLVLEGTSHYRLWFSGAAARRARRGQAMLLAVIAPLLLGLAGGAFASWPYRAALEAGMMGTGALMGLAGAVIAAQRLTKRRSAASMGGPSFLGRHPGVALVGSLVFVLGGSIWTAFDVADWSVPPDRLVVNIVSTHSGGRGRHTDVWTDTRRTYSSPLFMQIPAHPGTAAIYVGHYSRHLLRVEQPPGTGVDSTQEPAPSAAPLPAAFPSTPAFSHVLQTPSPGGVFYEPGPIGAYWYRSGSTVAVVVVGLEEANAGDACLLTSLWVDGQQTHLSAAPTAPGACGSSGVAGAGVVDCPAAHGWVVDRTEIPAGAPGTLFAEIHKANGDVFGFASAPTTRSDLPELDLASLGCAP
jgi:hypothetical protein